jgi:hypothetical protein
VDDGRQVDHRVHPDQRPAQGGRVEHVALEEPVAGALGKVEQRASLATLEVVQHVDRGRCEAGIAAQIADQV